MLITIIRVIYQHSVYSDNILMCLSKRCDFWYQASHWLQHFLETTVTLLVYFFQKYAKIVVTNSFWNSKIPIFCFCTVRKRFYAFATEAFTTHAKKLHRHFFDLIRTQYVDTNWSYRSAPLICLLQSLKGFGFGTSTSFLADFDHRWGVLSRLQVT